MTVLSNRSIIHRVEWGSLVIEPYNPAHVQPASYDLTVRLDRPLVLNYMRFHLLSTVERIRMPADLQGQVLARSSIARKGVIVEWAGFVDPGFPGEITLEVMAMSRAFTLYPGDRIAQIAFYLLDQPADPVYQGRYQNQVGPTESRFEHGDD